MNSLTYWSRLKKDLWLIQILFRTQDPNIKKDRHNPESESNITADPRSTEFSNSANPLDLPHKSTIRALFKAKSVDPKTYSPPSLKHLFVILHKWHWNASFEFSSMLSCLSIDRPKRLTMAWIIIWKFIQPINLAIFNISSSPQFSAIEYS